MTDNMNISIAMSFLFSNDPSAKVFALINNLHKITMEKGGIIT